MSGTAWRGWCHYVINIRPPQLRHNDDADRRQLSTTAAKQQQQSTEAGSSSSSKQAEKRVKSTCQRTWASNVHEARTRVDVVFRCFAQRAAGECFENLPLRIRVSKHPNRDYFEPVPRCMCMCVKVKTKWRMKMSTVHEFPWKSIQRKHSSQEIGAERACERQKGQYCEWVRAENTHTEHTHKEYTYNVENIWLFLDNIYLFSHTLHWKIFTSHEKSLEKW